MLVAALFVVYSIVQLLKGKCNSTASLEGKTIIVTGANTGMSTISHQCQFRYINSHNHQYQYRYINSHRYMCQIQICQQSVTSVNIGMSTVLITSVNTGMSSQSPVSIQVCQQSVTSVNTGMSTVSHQCQYRYVNSQ